MKSKNKEFETMDSKIRVAGSNLTIETFVKDYNSVLQYLLSEGLISGTYRNSGFVQGAGKADRVFYTKVDAN